MARERGRGEQAAMWVSVGVTRGALFSTLSISTSLDVV